MKRLRHLFKAKDIVNIVRLEGVIGAGRSGGALSDKDLAPVLEAAFTKGKPKAVALAINSPGGSPVQSSLIGARIRRLAETHKVPVFGFVEDVAASGGYWLACAADEIIIDPSSIVGSIGVIYASFGFHELISKNGIERRVYTAGENKSMLDPFRPEREEDIARLLKLQKIIHENFIAHVRNRRGAKLANGNLFTGDIWVGADAIENGLADQIGHLVPYIQAKFGKDVTLKPISARKGLLSRLRLPSFGTAIDEVEERALWSRMGLNAP